MAYTDKSFLAKIKPFVIADMKSSGILASLTAAQAFIESNKGNSGLTKKANNLFGIKGTYNGQSVKMLTTEYYNGIKQRVYADFRKYPSWQESINDHSAMFNRMSRYANLRGLTNYKLACQFVKEDGYATSPTYTQTLIATIEKYNLYEWDKEAQEGAVIRTLPTLKIGDRNDYVRSWQNYLITQGFNIASDGIFGSQTENAVSMWQLENGLKVTGIITPTEWHKIGVH